MANLCRRPRKSGGPRTSNNQPPRFVFLIADAGGMLGTALQRLTSDEFPTTGARPMNSVLDCSLAAGLGATMGHPERYGVQKGGTVRYFATKTDELHRPRGGDGPE